MSYKAVFRSLMEVFPQVDLRILKAVAIEHCKDVDAAVEFILSEVLPSLSGPSEESYTQPDAQEEHPLKDGLNKSNVSLGDQGIDEVNTILPPVPKSIACVTALSDDHAGLGHFKSPCMSESVVEGSQLGCVSNTKEPCSLMPSNEVVEKLKASFSEAKSTEYKMDNISDHENATFHFKSSLAKSKADDSPSDVDGGDCPDQLNAYVLEQIEDTLKSCSGSAENGTVAILANAEDSYSFGAKETISVMHDNDQNSSPDVIFPDLREYGAVMVNETHSSLSQYEQNLFQYSNFSTVNQDLYDSEADGTIPAVHVCHSDLLSSSSENVMDSTICGSEPLKDVNYAAPEHEKKMLTWLDRNFSDMVALENAMDPAKTVSDLVPSENALPTLESHQPSIITTRSGHVVSIDFLKDFISDSKSNKKYLASTVETTSNMLKDVELLEERAKLAKEEASVAGGNILTEVEELKQMLKHAKEANDMHAGEVYGEKAILAAEARELQSRLLNLSNEKNKYLPVIEEIHQNLEARLVAAEKEILTAEQEKLEKEELAQKALHEQQVIMDKIVEESQKLQQEAEENSKLREFLMDRGRVVDTLQGELAVICEDVLSLKDRVDGRVLLGKFQSLSTSSFASSSSSSTHKYNISSDSVLQPVRSTESPHMINQEHPQMRQADNTSSIRKEVYNGDKQKMFSDDDWELFEAVA